MIDLYVYYQVAEADAAALLPAVRSMQAGLGVPSSLKRRPEARDGRQTWMEVYLGVPPAFSATLAAAAASLPGLAAGARHVEVFVDLSPCA